MLFLCFEVNEENKFERHEFELEVLRKNSIMSALSRVGKTYIRLLV